MTSIVKILYDDEQLAAGTGIVIDRRHVMTCAHVVNEAKGKDELFSGRHKDQIQFKVPHRSDGEKIFYATVVQDKWFPPKANPLYSDLEDVAVLRLIDGEEFPSSVSAAHFFKTELNEIVGRSVKMVGFGRGGSDVKVDGRIEHVNELGRIQIDPKSEKDCVESGFSGAAILDSHTGDTLGLLCTRKRFSETYLSYGIPFAKIARHIEIDLHSFRTTLIPPIPRIYSARQEALENCINQLISSEELSHVGLRGMPGVGKTTLAKAIINNRQVASEFGSNRYWLTVGQASSPATLQSELFRDITGEVLSVGTIHEGRKRLREVFSKEKYLLVLDDVWSIDQISAFSELPSNGKVLITTRHSRVLEYCEASELIIDTLTLEQVEDFVHSILDLRPTESSVIILQQITGGLPLAIRLVLSYAKRKSVKLDTALAYFLDQSIDLLRGPAPDYDAEKGLADAFQLTISELEENEKAAFFLLASFRNDTRIPINILEVLATQLTEQHGGENHYSSLIRRLESLSLVEVANDADEGPFISLHNLTTDYLKSICPDLTALRETVADALVSIDQTHENHSFALMTAAQLLYDNCNQVKLLEMVSDFKWLSAQTRDAHGLQLTIEELRQFESIAPEIRLIRGCLSLSMDALINGIHNLATCLFIRLPKNSRFGDLRNAAKTNITTETWLPIGGSALSPVGQTEYVLRGHEGSVNGVSILNDDRLVSCSEDGSVLLWNIREGAYVVLGLNDQPVMTVRQLDRDRIVSIAKDGELRVWNVADRSHYSVGRHNEQGKVVEVLSPNLIVSVGENNSIQLWDLQLNETRDLPWNKGPIFRFFKRSCSGFIICGDKGNVSVFGPSGELIDSWACPEGKISDRIEEIYFDGLSSVFLVAGQGFYARDFVSNRESIYLSDERLNFPPIPLDSQSVLIMPLSYGDRIGVLDISTDTNVYSSLQILEDPFSFIDSIYVTSNGMLNFLSKGKPVALIEEVTSSVVSEIYISNTKVWNAVPIESSQKNGFVVQEDFKDHLSGYDITNGESFDFIGHTRNVNGFDCIAGDRILSWSKDGTIRLWIFEKAAPKIGHTRRVEGILALDKDESFSWSWREAYHWNADLIQAVRGYSPSMVHGAFQDALLINTDQVYVSTYMGVGCIYDLRAKALHSLGPPIGTSEFMKKNRMLNGAAGSCGLMVGRFSADEIVVYNLRNTSNNRAEVLISTTPSRHHECESFENVRQNSDLATFDRRKSTWSKLWKWFAATTIQSQPDEKSLLNDYAIEAQDVVYKSWFLSDDTLLVSGFYYISVISLSRGKCIYFEDFSGLPEDEKEQPLGVKCYKLDDDHFLLLRKSGVLEEFKLNGSKVDKKTLSDQCGMLWGDNKSGACSLHKSNELRFWGFNDSSITYPVDGEISAVLIQQGFALISLQCGDFKVLSMSFPGVDLGWVKGYAGSEFKFYSPNRVISFAADNILRRWDLTSRRQISSFAFEEKIVVCEFSGDGDALFIGTEGGLVSRFYF